MPISYETDQGEWGKHLRETVRIDVDFVRTWLLAMNQDEGAKNLTDVQAAEAVRLRLDWKYALGLSLADRGLDDSVLCEFRSRLVEHGMETPRWRADA